MANAKAKSFAAMMGKKAAGAKKAAPAAPVGASPKKTSETSKKVVEAVASAAAPEAVEPAPTDAPVDSATKKNVQLKVTNSSKHSKSSDVNATPAKAAAELTPPAAGAPEDAEEEPEEREFNADRIDVASGFGGDDNYQSALDDVEVPTVADEPAPTPTAEASEPDTLAARKAKKAAAEGYAKPAATPAPKSGKRAAAGDAEPKAKPQRKKKEAPAPEQGEDNVVVEKEKEKEKAKPKKPVAKAKRAAAAPKAAKGKAAPSATTVERKEKEAEKERAIAARKLEINQQDKAGVTHPLTVARNYVSFSPSVNFHSSDHTIPASSIAIDLASQDDMPHASAQIKSLAKAFKILNLSEEEIARLKKSLNAQEKITPATVKARDNFVNNANAANMEAVSRISAKKGMYTMSLTYGEMLVPEPRTDLNAARTYTSGLQVLQTPELARALRDATFNELFEFCREKMANVQAHDLPAKQFAQAIKSKIGKDAELTLEAFCKLSLEFVVEQAVFFVADSMHKFHNGASIAEAANEMDVDQPEPETAPNPVKRSKTQENVDETAAPTKPRAKASSTKKNGKK